MVSESVPKYIVRITGAVSRQVELSRTSRILFLLFSAYLVLPIIEVPLLGLSLSAPILFLVFLEVFLGSRQAKISHGRWTITCYLFLVGLLLSLVGNAIFRGSEIGSSDFVVLIRYIYWIIAFYTTMVVVSTSTWMLNSLGNVLAAGILMLACLRLYEAIAFGRWGAWTYPTLMSQNSYAIQFSTFAPFILALPFMWSGIRQRLAIGFIVLIFIAIAGNGSRSSWIAIAGGTVLFLLLFSLTQRSGIWNITGRIALVIVIGILIVAVAPDALLRPVIDRFNTLESLDGDKSFAIRQLMIQKGQRLFEQNPLFGAGIGRFREASVPLDIPRLLSYANQDNFDERSSHNSYISLLGETGLVGVVPFAILQLFLLSSGLRSAIRLAQSGQVWGIAIFSGYIGMSIHLWALSGLTGTAPWFIYGLVAGMIEYEHRCRNELRELEVRL